MKNRIRLTVKMLAFVMSVLILIVSLPVSSIASAIYNDTGDTNDISTENTSENADIQLDQKTKDAIVLEEDEALREENIKHFKLSDGTTKAVVYTQPVHYKDSNGKWIDIDNALTLNGSEYSAGNKSEIKFANKSGSSGLVSIKDGGYKIDFTPLNTNKVSVVIENPQSNNSRKFEDLSVLNNLVSKAVYTNIYDGIDIEYVLVGNNIKENIIVKEKQNSYTYAFELKLNKLSAELVNGAIILSDYDSGEQVYEIPAPYMLDASNEYSNSVEYTLVQNSKWKYTLTVTANPEWINAEERVFPVTIDPTVSFDSSIIYDESSDASNDKMQTLQVGNDIYATVETPFLPNLPNNSYVVSATLALYCLTNGNNYVAAFANIESNEMPVDYCQINQAGIWYVWEIGSIYKQWQNNTVSYNPVFLRNISGNGTSRFSSMEHTNGAHPILTVTYRDMKGIEPYWSYTSQSAGIAGTGSVNLATSNLVFSVPTLTTTDGLFGFTPALIYNSTLAGQDYIFANAQVSYVGAYAPKGFKFNGHETLMKSTHLDTDGTNKTYYVWSDGDGTEHYFYESKETAGTYEDEDGLQCTLKIVSENKAQITDANHNVRTFEYLDPMLLDNVTEAWYLTSISDKNNNKLSFELDENKNPTAIKVTPNGRDSIEMLTIEYSDSLRMNLVWNKTSGEARLLRYSDTPTGELSATGGAYLREMLFLHCDNTVTSEMLQAFVGDTDNIASGITVDAVATYEYDSSGKLIKATDTLSDYYIMYAYNPNSNYIYFISEYGNDTEGNILPLEFCDGYTEVTSLGKDEYWGTLGGICDDIITTYVFDEWGHATTIYSTSYNGEKVYSITTGQYGSIKENTKNRLQTSVNADEISSNYFVNGGLEASETGATSWTTNGNVSFSASSGSIGWDNAKMTIRAVAGGTSSVEQTAILQNGTYTFSLDLSSTNTTGMSVYLKASSNTYSYQKEISLNEMFASGSNAFASFTFTVHETTQTAYTVGIYAYGDENVGSNASITVDNLMLARTTGMADFNYVSGTNSTTTTNEQGKWQLPSYSSIVNTNSSFGNAIKIAGSVSAERRVYQRIYTVAQSEIDSFNNSMGNSKITNADVAFTISGAGKALSGMKNENSVFAIGLKIVCYKYGSDGLYEEEKEITAYFLSDKTGWQYASAVYILPKGSMIKSIDVFCEYSHNLSGAYFDDISLTINDKSVVNTNYNKDGTVKYTQVGGTKGTYYKYDDNKNVTDEIGKKSRISYKYDDKNNLIEVKEFKHPLSPIGDLNLDDLIKYCEINQTLLSKTTYDYDAYGLVSEIIKYDITSAKIIRTKYEYETSEISKLFGVVIGEINSFGQQIRYFYDSKSGRLISVIEPDNTGYYYTYDVIGNLTAVQPAVCTIQPQAVENSSNVQYEYNELNQLQSIVANGTTYTFYYDDFGNLQYVFIGSDAVMYATYSNTNKNVEYAAYASGTKVYYTYDGFERITRIRYVSSDGEETIYDYEYDSSGNLSKVLDQATNTSTEYRYDGNGRLVRVLEYDNGDMKNNFGISYSYDDEQRLSQQSYFQDYLYSDSLQNYVYLYSLYTYNENEGNTLKHLVTTLFGGKNYRIDYNYDGLYRYTGKNITIDNLKNSTSYEYLTYDDKTSYVVSQYKSDLTNNDTVITDTVFNYTYDSVLQNITEIKDANGNLLYKYTYDSLDRLVREDNSVTNKTYVYTYDNNGNLLSEKVYSYTTGSVDGLTPTVSNAYTYGNTNWGDQLTSYNGNAITYDSMGNPLTYYNSLRFEWGNVNNLISINEGAVTYTYNDSGIRTSKTVNGVTHTYHLDGTRIISEEYGNKLILYIYDEAGSIIGMAYRESSYASGVFDYYLFTKNLQGDIIGIYDINGNCVASYTYNAWGEHTVTNYTSANIGNINPFRYRGYYYDTETGFYYLNARYYDPQIKRFISPDTFDNLGANGDLNAFNLYAYCSNNPVMYVDPTGEIAGWVIALIVVAVVVVVDTVVETTILMNSEEYKAENVIDENGNVEIPNSAYFNNPIAQYTYAVYLCEKVETKDENGKTINYFTGGVYDIVGEWQWHNTVFAGINLFVGPAIANAIPYTNQARHVNLGKNLESESATRLVEVYLPSLFFRLINKKLTFGIFE